MVPTIPTIASKDPTDTFFRPSIFLRPPISSSSDHRPPICPYPPRSVSTLPQNRTGVPFAVGLIQAMAHQHPTQPVENGPKIIEGALQPSKSKSAKGGVLQILESKSTATKNLDKRVNWHYTSFEARLKRALKTESGSVDA